jgi:hypothetical protein
VEKTVLGLLTREFTLKAYNRRFIDVKVGVRDVVFLTNGESGGQLKC